MLHPPPPDWERQRVRNDDSVVLAVTLGGVRALLTGDISAAVEAEVAAEAAREWASRERPPPRLTLLKVAHHGSAGSTSTPFLQATQPAMAVVSAGADDPFGHPAPPALERLAAAGVEVWRTDRDGEVTRAHRRARRDGVAAQRAAASVAAPPRFRLDPVPQRVLRVERQRRQGRAVGAGQLLHAREALLELARRAAQRRLGLDAELARVVGDGEEQVADFVLDGARRDRARRGGAHFAHLLVDLVEHVAGRGPVEADRGRPRGQLVGAQQRRQRRRHAASADFSVVRPWPRAPRP